MALQTHTTAPTFSLPDQDGNLRSLDELLENGPLVLFFYPKDHSPGCTKEVCSFRDHYQELRDDGVSVAGVSRDDAKDHRSFRQKHDLPYPLLTDRDGSVHRAYDVAGILGLLSRRVTYLVGTDHKIWMAHEDNFRMQSHVRSVLKHLERSRQGR